MNWKKCLLLLSLTLFLITPKLSAELLTKEEISSIIPSEKSYSAEWVQETIWQIVQLADDKIKTTAEEAVKEAIIPLKADLIECEYTKERMVEALQTEIKRLEEESRRRLFGGVVISALIALVVGFVVGAVM